MLSETDKIDAVTFKAGQYARLVLVVEVGEWAAAQRLDWLRQKLETYTAYARERLETDYPRLAGLPVTVSVYAMEQPPQDVVDLLPSLQAQIEAQGLRWVYEPRYQAAA